VVVSSGVSPHPIESHAAPMMDRHENAFDFMVDPEVGGKDRSAERGQLTGGKCIAARFAVSVRFAGARLS